MIPYEVLPHRFPFFMLDKVEIIEEGRRARGSRQITANDPLVCPDGFLPQPFIIEAMAQISGIASGRQGRSLFAGISNMTFHGAVRTGDTLVVEGLVERSMRELFIFITRAITGDNVISEGKIVLHFDESR